MAQSSASDVDMIITQGIELDESFSLSENQYGQNPFEAGEQLGGKSDSTENNEGQLSQKVAGLGLMDT